MPSVAVKPYVEDDYYRLEYIPKEAHGTKGSRFQLAWNKMRLAGSQNQLKKLHRAGRK